MASDKPGYDDTPMLPGMAYRVHDCDRPQPPVVTAGSASTQDAPGAPPSDAVVLFDGSSFDGWAGKDNGPVGWKLDSGTMEVVGGTGSIHTTSVFGDCQLHVEFASPVEVSGDSQGRGNSGIFVMGLYEVQVLDCYNNPTYADGTTGAVYGQYPPLVNACRKPGEWNVYDILWEGPRFHGDTLVKPAFITVMFNGVVLHHHAELQGPTQHRVLADYTPHPEVGPLELQDHRDAVRFRNIWHRPLRGYDEG